MTLIWRLKLPTASVVFLWLAGLVSGWAADDNSIGDADYSQPWQINSYAKEAGFSQQRFFDITFTPDGDVWVAADDGLRRYDGFTWNLLGTNQGLPSSFIRAVCADNRGRLWVGSDAGAGIWDTERQKYDAQGSESGLANANVREIDQDPDGTVWFTCDQWPETTATPGGLSCLNPGSGQWETFRQTNGLPMDYVIGYFRDSTGRQFALTPNGWAQRQAEKWGPPLNPGYAAEPRVLQMTEASDGTLFAQGENTLLTLAPNGLWQNHPDSATRVVCATRHGEVVAVESDSVRGQLWFDRWDGRRFVRASAPVSCPAGVRLYHLREAPDGSLWCVGTGTVVRWTFQAGKWTVYPQLPPPVGADARGRVWFADEAGISVYSDDRFQKLAPGKFRVLSEEGQAMIWDAARKCLWVTAPQDPTLRTAVETSCKMINSIVVGQQGIFWILGQDEQGDGVVTRYDHGQTKNMAPPELHGRILTTGNALSPTQFQLVAHQRDNNLYGIAQLTDGQVVWLPLEPTPPPLTYPNLIHAAGRCWLSGYSGLYEQSLAEPGRWQQVTTLKEGGFGWGVANADEMLLPFSGGQSGRSGCALFSSNQWHWAYGDFAHLTFGRDQKTIYLPSRNGVFIRRQPGTLDFEYLRIPGDIFANIAVADLSGNLWLGTSDGTFRYQPGRTPPNTIALATAGELRRGAALPVVFRAQQRFETMNDPAGFRYSWRVDNGPWSPFEPRPEVALTLPELGAGAHQLEVRARDVAGNIDLTPATVRFTILSEPLQNRAWFVPLVAGLTGLLAWLVWRHFAHSRQLAATNAALRREIVIRRQAETELERARDELEHRVVERTGQLTLSNQQLQHEIAERKLAEEIKLKLEEQLHQAQKLEAIGTLAGGIAHDFNNILAVIIPYCDIVIEEMAGRPDLQEHLRQVLQAANRAKKLVQQILTFSYRQQTLERRRCDLQPAVKEALKLLRAALPSTIQMTQKISPTHPVLADPTQIHQVVMNLCVNAQHALAGRQGQLTVTLDEVLADESLCECHANLRPGLYVRISVRDTGCGISPEHRKRIFEPFFTTKAVGQGTGLGLAVVHGIVQNHAGAILVQSELGQGTEFQILLPAQMASADEDNPTILPPPQTNGEQILIVDDEPNIVNVYRYLLRRVGYKVTAHTDPQAALKDFITRPADIQLVLTDLTMPGLNGLELASKIYQIRPELPVVIATGFGGDLITPAQLAAQPNIRQVLEKPLNPESLIRCIAALLKAENPR